MMSKLTLADFNTVMYHCEAEERSITGYSCYNVPNYGSLVYAGLQGQGLLHFKSFKNLGLILKSIVSVQHPVSKILKLFGGKFN